MGPWASLPTKLAALACGAWLAVPAAPALADDAPSNAELYRMILELQSEQQRLVGEAAQAREQAERANQQLEATQQQLESTQQELEAAQQELEAREPAAVSAAPAEAEGFVREAELEQSFGIFGEANILRVTNSQMAYATLTTETGTLFGIGSNRIVQSNYETGFKVGAGFAPGGPHDFAVSYQHFENSASAKATPPFEAPDGNVYTDLVAFLAPPGFGQDAESATANLEFRYTSVDAEAGENLDVGSNLDLRLFGGVRFTHMAEHFKAYYFGDDFPDDMGVPLECDVNDCGRSISDYSFWGVGPRIGAGGRYPLPWGFSIFGQAAAALLVGEQEAEAGFTTMGELTEVAFIHRDFGVRVFPEIEIRAGLGWAHALGGWGHFFVDAGYEFQNYFNAVERFTFNDATAPGSINENSTDLGIDGIYVRGGLKF